jgi:phosphate transport system substrate-binding protein
VRIAVETPKQAAVVPETVLLRLSGSNTVGAVLGPRLAQAFMTETGDANVAIVPGPAADETRIVGQRGEKREVIAVSAHGSATAFTDMARGATEIGMASRRIKPAEARTLAAAGDMTDEGHEHVLALDGIAVIVNPANNVASFTITQLHDIFSGTITDWAQVGGPPGKIHILARDNQSGTFDTFKALVLGTAKISADARRIEDSRELSMDVSADQNAIGFIGLPYVLAARAVPIADTGATALLPNRLTVGTEDYPLARRLFLYTGAPGGNPLVARFTEFALSPAGQAIAEEAGFVALTVKPEAAVVPQGAPDRLRQLIGHATRLSTNFRFQPNSTLLDNRGQRDLDRLVNFAVSAHATPGQIILVGFADNQGKASSSLTISRKRAEAVAAGLAERGLPVKQLAAFGADLPVADNGTEEGREKNRRVEVYIAL